MSGVQDGPELAWLGDSPDAPFPDTARALRRPNGLLAAGGGLEPERLLRAYRRGIFPWYSAGEPILWWSPSPRCVFRPGRVHASRRTRQRHNTGAYRLTADRDFAGVIAACSQPRMGQRGGQHGTWITPALRAAYLDLHGLGYAHSVEAWRGDDLVGGVYGLAIGGAFFGESMFSRAVDASKIALVALSRQLEAWGFALLDAQVTSGHLLSLGAEEWPRARFEAVLADAVERPGVPGSWSQSFRSDPRW